MQANSLPINKNTSLDTGQREAREARTWLHLTGVVYLEPRLFKGKIIELGYHEGLPDKMEEAELLSIYC